MTIDYNHKQPENYHGHLPQQPGMSLDFSHKQPKRRPQTSITNCQDMTIENDHKQPRDDHRIQPQTLWI